MRTEKNTAEINTENLVKEIRRVVSEDRKAAFAEGKKETQKYYRQTERRLYAYPELLANIERYKTDIEDLEREGYTDRSKSIVKMPDGSGEKLTPEEIQAGRIRLMQLRLVRDQWEAKDIEYALWSIEDDNYYPIIENKFFKRLQDDEIAQMLHCDSSTVRRNKNRLVQRITVKLYGAEANT